ASASVVCTPNHPFYTRSGWKSAEHLSVGEDVLYVRDHCTMHLLPPTLSPHQEMAKGSLQSREEPVLLGHMQARSRLKTVLRDHEQNQQHLCLAENEGQQSYAQG